MIVDFDVKTDPNTDLDFGADARDAGAVAAAGGREQLRHHGAKAVTSPLMLITLYSPQRDV